MRPLVLVIAVAALGWGGYWFVGAVALEKALVGWIDERRADGWRADYSQIKTRGFPNRFDTTLTGLMLADPKTGVAWTAPFFQVLSLSYRPNHIIAVLPGAHSLATPQQTIEIVHDRASGSVVFRPESALTLDRSQFVIENLVLVSTANWSVKARELRIATRPAVAQPLVHEIGIEAAGVDPGGWFDEVAQTGDLPAEFSALKIDARILFDAPWDRFAVERARPQPRQIDITEVRAAWGEMDFRMAGKLEVDEAGVPTGALSVQARNWRDMLKLAVATGTVHPDAAPAIETGLEFLSGLTGTSNHIDTTLNFRSGFIGIGPIPLGPAPRIFIR